MASNSFTIFYFHDMDKPLDQIEWNLRQIPTEVMPYLAGAIINEHLERKNIPVDFRKARLAHGIKDEDLFNQR